MEAKNRDLNGGVVEELKKAIMDADFDSAAGITEKALKEGVSPQILMEESIGKGIDELEQKLFNGYKPWGHPILYMAVEAARRSLLVLEPYFKVDDDEIIGTVVLGTPEGDVHDMGGKMVALTLIAAGFKVIYLGRDVPTSLFVHKVKEHGAQIMAISSYQTNGFKKIEEIIGLVKEGNITDKVKIMAGGSAITQKFTDKIGIGYGVTASDAVRLAKKYIGGK